MLRLQAVSAAIMSSLLRSAAATAAKRLAEPWGMRSQRRALRIMRPHERARALGLVLGAAIV